MRLLIYILVILNTASCQQSDKINLDRKDFSISYPSHLNLDDSGKEGTAFILTAEKDDVNDIFVENINLVISDAGNVSFNDFVAKTEKEVGSVANIVEKKFLKVNGKECFKLKLTTSQNGTDLTFIQNYYVENQKVYALTFSSETRKFNDYFEEMNEVLLSFKIK